MCRGGLGGQDIESKGKRDGMSRHRRMVQAHRSQGATVMWPVHGPFVLLIMSKIVFSTASQTCSSWGPSKELERAKCKEDLQGLDVEKIFSASSRIAKVTSGEGGVGFCVGLQCLDHLWGVGPCSAWPGSLPLPPEVAVPVAFGPTHALCT